MFPEDIQYTTTHLWIRPEDSVATIGITRYAADQLSDISYIELPAVGDALVEETILGTIESVKAAVDILSPIDGEVVEVNDAAAENPDLISEDPYDDGWLIKLRLSDDSQLESMMTAEEYQYFVQAESGEVEEEAVEEDEDEIEDVE